MNRSILPRICVVGLALAAKPLAAQQFAADSTLTESGKRIFAAKACMGCHTIGKGDLGAPDLAGLFERRSVEWVKKWLLDPSAMLEHDDTAKTMLKQYNNMRMPNLNLTDGEILALMHYIAIETKKARQGS